MRFNRLAVDALVSSELSFGYYQMNNHTELNRTPVVTKLRQTSRNRTCIFGAATVSCNCVPAYPRRLRRYRRVEKGVCYADCVGAKAGEGSSTSFAVYSDRRRNPYTGRFTAVERRTGFEPAHPAWKAGMLPTTSAAHVPPISGGMEDR